MHNRARTPVREPARTRPTERKRRAWPSLALVLAVASGGGIAGSGCGPGEAGPPGEETSEEDAGEEAGGPVDERCEEPCESEGRCFPLLARRWNAAEGCFGEPEFAGCKSEGPHNNAVTYGDDGAGGCWRSSDRDLGELGWEQGAIGALESCAGATQGETCDEA